MDATEQDRATWTAAFINDLPDSSFLYIEPGGSKDEDGKTVPRSLRHFPVKDSAGNVDMPHLRNALSRIPQSSLPQSVKDLCTRKAQRLMAEMQGSSDDSPRDSEVPRENLYRMVDDIGVTRAEEDGGPSIMFGHFSRFNEWAHIRSVFEGEFLERIAPGAFKKTIGENRNGMRVLFQHGRDPHIGQKPIGQIAELREDPAGAYYEVELFDTTYVRDLVPAIRAGAVGSSFNFTVMREEWNDQPEPSDYNPRGLRERTIKEAQVREFGPVTFPAYEGATAGIRSITDEFMVARDAVQPEDTSPATISNSDTAVVLNTEASTVTTTATTEAAPPHPEQEPRRGTQPDSATTTNEERTEMSIEEMRARVADIRAELEEIAAQNTGSMLDAPTQNRWDQLTAESDDLKARIKATEDRQAYLDRQASDEQFVDRAPAQEARPPFYSDGTGTYVTRTAGRDQLPANVFDVTAYHGVARSQEHMAQLLQDGALRAVDGFDYPTTRDTAAASGAIERLLRRDDPTNEMAMRALTHGAPAYRSAFFKTLTGKPLTTEEQQYMARSAMIEARAATSDTFGGVTVPIQIDPTILPTSNGALNPFRAIARIEQTTSYLWQAVTSSGVTAVYRDEGTHMTDGTPTLVAPQIQPERADVFIPYSWEAGQDQGSLASALGVAIQDAKDTLEATKFSVGAGHSSNEPQGVLIGAGTAVATSNGTMGTAFSAGDLFVLEANLPPRYMANATWVSSPKVFSAIRQFDTTGGGLFWANLNPGVPETLIGYPVRKASTVGTSTIPSTAGAVWAILGDFSRYVIVDRVGLQVRVIPDLFGGTAAVHYPTGQSGLVAYWRNSAGVIDSNAFRVGTISRGLA